MKQLRCSALLTAAGWIEPAYVTLDDDGLVVSVSPVKPTGPGTWDKVNGFVIPGFQNAHSHAFQYAMGGLAEHLPKGAASDDFWSWRDTMYRLAGKVTPDHVEAIAGMLFAEMLRFGYTAVAEFHYLHHDPEGRPYKNTTEIGQRLMAAAETAGIHLTLVPVLYRQGGFSQKASPQQRRFVTQSLDEYLALLADTRAAAKGRSDLVVGFGAHSLRAAQAEEIKQLLQSAETGPAHIHIAEQKKEVDDCIRLLGRRPVTWLLENVDPSNRLSLVHATHVDASELKGMITGNVNLVVCPSTEGNLGDGFFPLREFIELGGEFAIGSDSHIGLNPLEELRWFDYGQRLKLEKRNVLCRVEGDDSGRIIHDMAWRRGRMAMGLPADDYFAPGQPFDGVALDPEHPILCSRPPERRLSALIYGGDPTCFLGTLRRGEWLVEKQKHRNFDKVKASFVKTLSDLSR